jgi:wyosine [tRNA(Phe)-imidazoG37] synthetase (radical SAM superfamily)
VFDELEHWLQAENQADYITLSGSGEPTLHSAFGEVLQFIRSNCPIPAVLLTNGSTLHLPEVRSAACHAHIVKVSLSAWNQASFEWVNRSHSDLDFNQVIEGYKAFRAMYGGELWMEVFLVVGMNSSLSDVIKIAALAQQIRPDRIHLNTAVRPPAEEFAVPVSSERLNSLVRLFRPTAEVIAEFKPRQKVEARMTQEEILSMLKRRPCTARQIAESFGVHMNEVSKYLGNLMREKRVNLKRCDSSLYYMALGGEECDACPQVAEKLENMTGPHGPEKNGVRDSRR